MPQKPGTRRPFDDQIFAIAAMVVFIAILTGGVLWADSAVRSWHERDLERRAELVVRALEPDIGTLPDADLVERLENMSADSRLIGVLICFPDRRSLGNRAVASILGCRSTFVKRALAAKEPISAYLAGNDVQISVYPLQKIPHARVLVVQDQGFIWSRRQGLLRIALAGGILAIVIIAFALYQAARAMRVRQGRRMLDLFRRAARGEETDLPPDVSRILDNLNATVARLRSERGEDHVAGPERLRHLVAERMPETPLVLVANREPYIHVRDGERIRLDRPASGLVTGVEPLLRACGGIWVGHGSGSADREVADPKGRLAVPPDQPEYVLRRVWLTQREEEGYYYGFSNEGLWPLCHIAHARPTFRTEDWEQYQIVNRKFAEAAAEEAREHGLVLVQDYHFALLPAELRELAPGSVISLFWHIPWPNDEVFGICPWKEEILTGMLGADVIGFHTRYHCLNFLNTVSRYLECKVALETMTVEFQGHVTRVKPYPISVQWPYPPVDQGAKAAIRQKLGIDPEMRVAVGVDRADYTKGLIEKVEAVDALLSSHPDLVGRFVLAQIAAPSRTHIKRYRDLQSELEETATRINRKYGRDGWIPIMLQIRHFTPQEVRALYATADVALVTPLHDGMNLVAKEFVASRSDSDGTLILSKFTGAATELEGAVVVNPYDTSEVAEAIYRVLTMSPAERTARMTAMRASVEKNTIYDWSASLLSDLAEIWERRNASWRDHHQPL
ncbi:MAG: trehalose-6-phosphate synthase [Thermoanaerobaculia bacterium]